MQSPFQPGDLVIYTPTDRAYGLEAMFDPPARLDPGKTYQVERIEKGEFLVVVGYQHPLGGLHWTNFSPAS